jgi:hypothetical protein
MTPLAVTKIASIVNSPIAASSSLAESPRTITNDNRPQKPEENAPSFESERKSAWLCGF